MKTYSCISILLIALLLPLSSHANTFCVSDATGLQTALTTAAGNGEDDTVQIMQGTYVGSFIYASTEAFNLTVEGGYVSGCGSRVVDPANTVLDANGTGSVLVLSTPDTIANLAVDGLTLQNGLAGNGKGGGIYADTLGNVIITKNTIKENSATGDGGAVYFISIFGTIALTNNTITGNSVQSIGGGVYASCNGTITLTNNTITGNSAQYGGGVFITLSINIPIADVVNNIIWNNTATSSGNDLYLENDANGDAIPSPVYLYNNDFDQSADGIFIQHLPFTIDPSNLDNEDPLFVDAVNDNYRITDVSPCVDTGRLEGAPPDDMDGDPRPLGTGVDVGADEYNSMDTDYDGFPHDEDNCPNDYNPLQEDTYPPQGNGIGDACDCEGNFDCDLDVDANDVTSFLNDFGREQFFQPCTNENPCNGDFNCDVAVDANDVTNFLEDFGREQYYKPCPACVEGNWCVYQ